MLFLLEVSSLKQIKENIDKVDGNVTLKITEDPKNVLYLIIGNKEITDEELEKVTNNLISLTTKFASGKATIVK